MIIIATALTIAAPVSSETARIGDPVTLSDGSTATVTHVEKRRNRARDGYIRIATADGTCTLEVRGKSVAADIGSLIGGGLGGLLVKGAHAKVEAGTPLECNGGSWSLIGETADGDGYLLDYGLSRSDCDKRASTIPDAARYDVIYCEMD